MTSRQRPPATSPGIDVVLISTYELGRQPFGLASPAAWLREAGLDVKVFDVSRQRLDWDVVGAARLVAFHLPMHTATRLAAPLIARVAREHPHLHVCAYGLYAPLNFDWLTSLGVHTILGGEFEGALLETARAVCRGDAGEAPRTEKAAAPGAAPAGVRPVPRLAFRVPDRDGLPSPDRYAALVHEDGRRTVVGYTEASRGCKHLCRHCPIVPVYAGQFRVVPADIVMADVARQVSRGARHITFGDPDFFNGIRHARTVVTALAREFPGLTYDVTIKIEHLLAHGDALPLLRETGCLFVTSAVESIDDQVLVHLRKGHTRRDTERAIARCRDAGLTLAPTFVAFTPWTTVAGYAELLTFLEDWDLVEQVAPVQLAIRLLVTEGSGLLELEDVRRHLGRFDPATLAYPWRHPDPEVDALQRQVETFVATRAGAPRRETFAGLDAILSSAGGPRRERARTTSSQEHRHRSIRRRTEIAWLDEPWYC